MAREAKLRAHGALARGTVAATAIALVALGAGGTTASAADDAEGNAGACPAAHAMPVATISAARSEQSLLCLVNRERARVGARPLQANRCLARAADRHARDMVRRGYFEHRSRDGRDFSARILATGYAAPLARWTVGENLAWGAAPNGHAAWVLDAWMNSRAHRENLLRPTFRDIGLAAVSGAPVDGEEPRATWAAEFGVTSEAPRRCG